MGRYPPPSASTFFLLRLPDGGGGSLRHPRDIDHDCEENGQKLPLMGFCRPQGFGPPQKTRSVTLKKTNHPLHLPQKRKEKKLSDCNDGIPSNDDHDLPDASSGEPCAGRGCRRFPSYLRSSQTDARRPVDAWRFAAPERAQQIPIEFLLPE